jgi:predicted RNA-binding Zn-ribbon protein involved in translation (DUF1610 family)
MICDKCKVETKRVDESEKKVEEFCPSCGIIHIISK